MLGEFGIWIGKRSFGESDGAAAAARVEELGFGALWLGGSPRLADLRPLLEASEELTVATSVVNVWRYPAAELAADWVALERDFPGRTLVGIGLGHPEADSEYRRPLAAMREYLDVLDRDGGPPPERRILAALAPKMTELAAARSAGSIPYCVPLGHTRLSRERLGAGPLLAPELTCVLDADRATSRAKAREFARLYLGLGNYTRAMVEGGFTAEDTSGEGSDGLIDAIVAQGSAADVAVAARAQLEAGADHVALQTVGGEGIPAQDWAALAAELFN